MYEEMSQVSINSLIGILLNDAGLVLFKELISAEITFSLTVGRRNVSFSITLSLIFKILGWSLNFTIILEMGSELTLEEHKFSA